MYMYKMQIACLCMILLMVGAGFKKHVLHTGSTKIFQIFVAVVTFNLVFDMISSYTVNYAETVPVIVNKVVHVLFVGSIVTCMALVLSYVILLLDVERKTQRIFGWIIHVPHILALIFMMCSPFEYNQTPEGNYATGRMVFACYAYVIWMVLIGIVIFCKWYKRLSKDRWMIIGLAVSMSAIGGVLQYFNAMLLMSGMWLTILALAIFLIHENPNESYNNETGMFGETGFMRMIHENLYQRERFHLVLFTVSNIKMIQERYGIKVANQCLRAISRKVRQSFHHNVYALDDNELAFFAPNESVAEMWIEQTEKWLSKPLFIAGEKILIQTQMRPWTFSREKTKSEEQVLYNIETYFTKVLAEAVYIDQFSGLMNRNAYERDTTHMMHLNEPGHVWCTIVDINNLKKMNDTWGHAAGDALIKSCADMLKAQMPEEARIYRIGGDEFAIINLGKSKREIDELFEQLEKAKEESNIQNQYTLEFAIGTAEYQRFTDNSILDAFARADKKMYANKEQMHKELLTTMSKKEWDWVRELDALSYETMLFDAWGEISENYLFIENEINNMTHFSTGTVDEFSLAGEYIYQGLKAWTELIHPADKNEYNKVNALLASGIQKRFQASYRVENRWGEYVEVTENSYLCTDENGKPKVRVGIITVKKEDVQIDVETGLLNRHEFSDRVKKLCDSHNTTTGLLLIGLNNFRKINAMYSYAIGDEVLKTIAEKIEVASPARSSQYRYGGDMFALIYPHTTKMEMYRLFDQIEKSLEGFYLEGGERIYLTLSGGAIMMEDGLEPDGIKNALEHAVKIAKETGKGVMEFASDTEMAATASRFRVREEIRRCVRDDMYGFYLNYQPLLNGSNKELYGCEALLRWKHPDFEGLGPEQFIPVLEETGQIMEAGRWVITTALTQVKEWQKKKPDFSVNVNISYVQMQQPDLAAFIVNEVKRLELSPKSIVIELTESCKINNYDAVTAFVDYLKCNGIAFALDDFGTGYSSFEVLKNVSTDWIKLEHNYVSSIKKSITDRNILIHIIELCHSLGIKVCAEGIEDEQVCQSMMEQKVEFLQGYYISKPLSAELFEREFLDIAES